MPSSKGTTPRQEELGHRLRELRERIDLSQEELAHESDTERTYISQLELGRRNPSVETLCKLANALDCDVAELVQGLQTYDGRS